MLGVGNKLSKHVLGMKFMRRTKDEIDKTEVEQKHREHFSSSAKPSTSVPATFQKLETIVEEVPSYSQCIGFKFGRLSFGGFNPTVEYNVKKRNWRAVHVGQAPTDDEDEDGEAESEDVKPEVDVDDEEMAKTYGSIIGTVGRQMMERNQKKSKSKKEKKQRGSGGDVNKGAWMNTFGLDVVKKVGGWTTKGLRARSHQKKSGGEAEAKSQTSTSRHGSSQESSSQGRRSKSKKKNQAAPPPEKKRKFMKPSDDDY